jgi:hypothetical protein
MGLRHQVNRVSPPFKPPVDYVHILDRVLRNLTLQDRGHDHSVHPLFTVRMSMLLPVREPFAGPIHLGYTPASLDEREPYHIAC